MACYQLDPPMVVQQVFFAWDQFGLWEPLSAEMTEWLCVPSAKLVFVGVEEQSWGNIKKMYR
jgi:hypothetical protein